jgi:hypothetical protein
MQERREYRKPGGQRWQPNWGRFLIEPKKKRTRLGPLDDQIPSYEVLLRNASGWPVEEPFSQNLLRRQPDRPPSPQEFPKAWKGWDQSHLQIETVLYVDYRQNCIVYRLAITTWLLLP